MTIEHKAGPQVLFGGPHGRASSGAGHLPGYEAGSESRVVETDQLAVALGSSYASKVYDLTRDRLEQSNIMAAPPQGALTDKAYPCQGTTASGVRVDDAVDQVLIVQGFDTYAPGFAHRTYARNDLQKLLVLGTANLLGVLARHRLKSDAPAGAAYS
jgi:hypothetical protein